MAIKKTKNKIKYEFNGCGLTTKERNKASVKFQSYLEDYPNINKHSDLVLLEDLIFQEMMHERIKEKINGILSVKPDKEKEEAIPTALQKALSDSLNLQLQIKRDLGLFSTEKQSDAYMAFQNMREDYAEYRKRNPDFFKTTCPFCSNHYFLKRRTVNYEVCGTEWFKDKVLFNQPLWECYKANKINKKEIASILGVAEDYIDWVADHLFKIKNTQVEENTKKDSDKESEKKSE